MPLPIRPKTEHIALYYKSGTFIANISLKHADKAKQKLLIIAKIFPTVLFLFGYMLFVSKIVYKPAKMKHDKTKIYCL